MKTISTLILTSICFICIAQDFGKKGTNWQHCYVPYLEFPITYDYIEVQSTRDTIVQNLQCHELVVTHQPSEFGVNNSILICNEKEKVYYVEGDSLHLLYDFSLGKGDSYVVRYPIIFDTNFLLRPWNTDIYSTIHIDSISYNNIDGKLLKVQHISNYNINNTALFGKYITEYIGFENWVLPNWWCGPCDAHVFSGLYKFNDTEISFHDTSSFCRLVGTNNLKNSKNELAVYPIPAIDHIIIESLEGNEIQTILIYDLSGKSFPFESEKTFDKTILHFNLNAGLYLLEIRLANGELKHAKFLIGE